MEGYSLVAASEGFSLQWLLLLWHVGFSSFCTKVQLGSVVASPRLLSTCSIVVVHRSGCNVNFFLGELNCAELFLIALSYFLFIFL